MVLIGTTAAIITIVLWTIAGTINKRISSALGSHIVGFLYTSISMAPILLAVVIVGTYSIPIYGLVTAAIGGLFLATGFIFNFKALQTENLSSISALAEISPAVLVLFGLLVLGEKVTSVQMFGIIIVFAGTLMIITTEKLEINRKLLPALLAVLAWTVYWIIISYSVISSNTFALPIFISRIVAVPIMIAYLLSSKGAVSRLADFSSSISKNRSLIALLALTVIASVADASGDTLFGITVGSPVLVIGAALIALQPMAQSFMGFVLYKEKLTRLQLYGLVVMIVGALVLSVL